MLTFPLLGTGAVSQYPTSGSSSYNTQVLSFLDGAEQRYRLMGAPLHAWIVQLALLDDTEANALELFLRDTQGSFAAFSFTDPKTGIEYPSCHLKSDTLETSYAGPQRADTTLVICENRTPAR